MPKIPINRRDFMKGGALAAGAAVLAACSPAAESVLDEPTPMPAAQLAGLKIWVVYDSVYGNTEKIAQALGEGVEGGQAVQVVKAADARYGDMGEQDILILGSPTHGGTYTEPVKTFLGGIPANGLSGRAAAAFDTGSTTSNQGALGKFFIGLFGYASLRIARELKNKGASAVAAETFFVLDTEGPLQDGELERARQWVKTVMGKV